MGQSLTDKPLPYFFLSYVHDSGSDDSSVGEFYHRLTHDVRLISGKRHGEIGFCDVTLNAGDRWSADLVQNLSTAQVFVPLLSPAYFASDACGKEWTVFTRRKAEATAPNAARASLVPIFWISMTAPELPDFVLPYQYRDSSFGRAYASHGLRALIQRKALADDLHRFVEALAKRIVDLYRTIRVAEAPLRPAFDEVESAFMAAAPPSQRTRSKPDQATRGPNQVSRRTKTGMPRLNPADPWPKEERR